MKISRRLLLALALTLPASLWAETPKAVPAITPVSRPEPGWQARHAKFNEVAKAGEAKLVFLGDSITQGWEGAGKPAWEKYWAPYQAFNLGIGGDRTEHVLWRIDHGNFDGIKPKLVVLMIGTNNTGHAGRDGYQSPPAQTAEGVKLILTRIHEKTPDAQVLVLGIFPRGKTAADPMRKQNEEINAIIKGYADGKKVHYLDIGATFLKPDGELTPEIMPDALHLSVKGYELWAEAIAPKVKELMGQP